MQDPQIWAHCVYEINPQNVNIEIQFFNHSEKSYILKWNTEKVIFLVAN